VRGWSRFFNTINQTLGFRQFLLRGLETIAGEWIVISMYWILNRMFSLQC
jgi:hypothetical protein